jgi:hypothetical protein
MKSFHDPSLPNHIVVWKEVKMDVVFLDETRVHLETLC